MKLFNLFVLLLKWLCFLYPFSDLQPLTIFCTYSTTRFFEDEILIEFEIFNELKEPVVLVVQALETQLNR